MNQVDPRVLAAAGGEEGVGERRIAGPAGFRGVPEDRGVEDDPAGEQQPEGERVQARERHVARADHQRQEVVGQARHHRHDEQEDHRGAVHREQLVVGLGGDQRVLGGAQLQADHQRLDAAEDEEHEREDHVHDPDPLVVGGREPAHEAALLAIDAVGDYLGCGGGVGGHRCLLLFLSLWARSRNCRWYLLVVSAWAGCGLGWAGDVPGGTGFAWIRGSRSCSGPVRELSCGPFLGRVGLGFFEHPLLVGQPDVEFGRFLGPHDRDHAGVAATAEVGALPAVDAGLFDLEPAVVVVAGDRLVLAPERGDPPRVHDVRGDDVERHRGFRGDDHFRVGVGRSQAVGVAGAGVDVLPDELAADDLDFQRFAVGRQVLVGGGVQLAAFRAQRVPAGARVGGVLDRGELDERDHREHNEDQRGPQRPADLQARVAVDLGGHGALALAELPERISERPLDGHEDHERDVQRDLVEAVDFVGV